MRRNKCSRYASKIVDLARNLFPDRRIILEQSLAKFLKKKPLLPDLQERCKRYNVTASMLRIDIYIDKLCAIEVHGEQHCQTVRFSNDILDLNAALERRKILDSIKQDILKHLEIPLVVIWFDQINNLCTSKLNELINKELIATCLTILPNYTTIESRKTKNVFHTKRLLVAKQYRKTRYKAYKAKLGLMRKNNGKV